MKTLIFNGSGRKNGDTENLIQELVQNLDGEYKIVNTFDGSIKACVDCRYCCTHPKCCVQDGWEEVASYLQECDNLVIASPIYFGELTGPVMSVLSRMQMFWAAKLFRKEALPIKPKRGGIILVGGGNGSAAAAIKTASLLLRQMNAKEIGELVSCFTTDVCRAADDPAAVEQVKKLTNFFNRM